MSENFGFPCYTYQMWRDSISNMANVVFNNTNNSSSNSKSNNTTQCYEHTNAHRWCQKRRKNRRRSKEKNGRKFGGAGWDRWIKIKLPKLMWVVLYVPTFSFAFNLDCWISFDSYSTRQSSNGLHGASQLWLLLKITNRIVDIGDIVVCVVRQ